MRSRKKKIQGLLESLRRVLKKLNKNKCPAVRTFSRISTKSLVLIILKAFYRHLQLPSRPVTRLFYGDVQSNAEIDQMRPEGQVPGGGSCGCLRLNCVASLQLGGAHFKRVSISLGAFSLGECLNLTPLKWLDGYASKTSMVW